MIQFLFIKPLASNVLHVCGCTVKWEENESRTAHLAAFHCSCPLFIITVMSVITVKLMNPFSPLYKAKSAFLKMECSSTPVQNFWLGVIALMDVETSEWSCSFVTFYIFYIFPLKTCVWILICVCLNCRSKCSCHQLTLQATACTPGAQVNQNAGYVYKRLEECLPTGSDIAHTQKEHTLIPLRWYELILVVLFLYTGILLSLRIYECNKMCKCSAQMCTNRLVQHGLQVRLQLFKTQNKGWGIRCLDDVAKGSFVCIYAGEKQTYKESLVVKNRPIYQSFRLRWLFSFPLFLQLYQVKSWQMTLLTKKVWRWVMSILPTWTT